jgi:hypothetical protein
MFEIAYGVIIFGFAFLGFNLFMKFREMASWKAEEDFEDVKSTASAPGDLLNLQIEEPDDTLGSIDETSDKPDQH